MIKRPTILLIVFLSFANGSDGLRLIHADKNIGEKIGSQLVRIFKGKVHFQQDTLHMYCDEARFLDKENKIEFLGNVLINDGTNILWARRIDYYPDLKQAICTGNVRIKGKSDSLSAEYLKYSFENKKATAQENVFLFNRDENVRIWGKYGFHNPEDEYSFVKGDARLVRIDSSGSKADTFTVNAQRLEYFAKEDYAVATDSVFITQDALRAVCDTAIYYNDREITWLINNPFVWYQENRLHGDKIRAQFDSLIIRKLFIYGEASAETIVDSASNKISKLTAKEIQFDIVEKKPKTILAFDNATSIYYLEEEGKDKGINYATSDTIIIHFTKGEVDSIQIIGGAEGVFYPAGYKGAKKFEQQ